VSTSLQRRTAHADAPEADLFVNEARAAALLSVNPRTLQQWRLRGTGPTFVRISSRCVRYRYRDLYSWAEARMRASTSEA
jgi:hypothetical protein